jgi:pimeloyl-ACP methyl ester carboxylesterase
MTSAGAALTFGGADSGPVGDGMAAPLADTPDMAQPPSPNGGFRALADAQRRLPETGQAALGDGLIEYVVAGDALPAIVLVGGYGVPLSSWALVIDGLRTAGTVFAYNRPGVGGSPAPQREQTGSVIVEVLRETLAAAELRPPYIVVAHSLGGLYAQLYARRHPRELAGLVLLEATHPDDDPLERRLRFLPRSIGSRKLGRTAELRQMPQTAAELRQAGPFPDVPLAVVTGAKTPSRLTATSAQIERRADRQRQLAALTPRGEQILARRSGSIPQITDPGVVVEAVRRLIDMTPQAMAS